MVATRSIAALCALVFAGSVAAVDIDFENLPDTGLDTSDWEAGELPPLDDMWDVNDFQIAAKNTLAGRDYAQYRTAALDEITYNANLDIWRKVKINGFSFRDVSNLNLETSILGYNFSAPFFIAPAASAGRAHPDAELNLARAAGDAGILYVPSISATKSIEEIAGAAGNGQIMFHQEYIWSNRTQVEDELRRFEDNNFRAIFLTVDNSGITGVRTRSIRYTGITSSTGHDASFDLNALAEFRSLTDLPIVPKGVKTAEDAKRCLDLGFPAVYISNHGGRVVDGVPTALEIILDIKRKYPEVLTQMEVYADGGVRRANHIIALLALGVRAVGLGRPPMFANVFGQEGVAKMIDLLRTELETTLELIGQPDVSQLDESYVNTRLIEMLLDNPAMNIPF